MEMDNYHKLELLLGGCTSVFKDLFLTRWRASQGMDWQNSRSFGNKLLQFMGKVNSKNCQKMQKAMVESGDSNTWDITLLSMLLTKCNFPGYKSGIEIDEENKAIKDTADIRNTLAHLPIKILTDEELQEHFDNVKRILGILNVPQEQIDDMCEDASKGAIYSERRANLLKIEGNTLYEEGKYKEACDSYTRALDVSRDISADVMGTLYSNRAQTYLKMTQEKMPLAEQTKFYKLALNDSLTAIKSRPTWSKPFLRAAEAYKGLCQWKEAVEHFERCTVLDPSMMQQIKSQKEVCQIMANIRLIANPDDEEGLPITFDERIKLWNDDPKSDGVMSRRRWMAMEQVRNGAAYTMLGYRYRGGWDVKQDLNEAMRCFIRAWKLGDPEGTYQLSRMKYRGQVSEPDPVTGFKLMKEAAEMIKYNEYDIRWISISQFCLGTLYDMGLHVEQDYAEAARWYKKASRSCDRAAFALGQMYASGTGVRLDRKLAIKYWILAAQKGNLSAKFKLAVESICDEEMQSHTENYLQSLRTSGLPACYIQAAEAAVERTDQLIDRIQNRSTSRAETLSVEKSIKFDYSVLLPYMSSSPLAMRIIETKLKRDELLSLLTTAEEDLPFECIDLYYDAFQPDVEFVPFSLPQSKFIILCKKLLNTNTFESDMERKLRFCIAHATTTEDYSTNVIWLQESIKLYPNDPWFQTYLSNIYGFQGKHKEGLKLADNVLQLDPTNEVALFCRATHLRKLNRNIDAIHALNVLLQYTDIEDRKRPEYLYTLGLLYFLSDTADGKDKFLSYYRKGQEAETKLLPCFLPYDNGIKMHADMYANMLNLSALHPPSSGI